MISYGGVSIDIYFEGWQRADQPTTGPVCAITVNITTAKNGPKYLDRPVILRDQTIAG